MGLLDVAPKIAALLLPVALFWAFVRRSERDADEPARRLWIAAGTLFAGGLLFIPTWLLERWIEAWAGLERATTDLAGLVYAFLVVAPLEEGLKVLVTTPSFRSRFFRTPRDGVLFASAAAMGFVTAHNAEFLALRPGSAIDLTRALLAVPAHVFFAASWGYALGVEARTLVTKRLGGRTFSVAWLLAMLFNGVYDHIVFARRDAALVATAPILLLMLAVAGFVGRSLSDRAPDTPPSVRRRTSFLPVIAPPSMQAVRAALWRTERPVMLRWIAFGTFVTTGLMTTTLVAAIALGHRVGVDFAAVDSGDGSVAGAAPLILLGAASLSAFPIAGYLVARASASRSVLESAISAGLAIGGALVLLGLAAPVAVVFAIAFAPVAFGLACAGAWIGITR